MTETQPPPVPPSTDFGNLPPHNGRDSARRKDMTLGLAIIAVTFAFCMGFSVWAREQSAPPPPEPPAPPSVDEVTGWPNSVDFIDTLKAARERTERSGLAGIVAQGVTSDGRIDFGKGSAMVRYSFQSSPGQGAQPRRPRGAPARQFCGRQSVYIREDGLGATVDVPSTPCPSKGVEPLPDPGCGPKQVWKLAIDKGAPKDGRARLEYYRARVGPAWRFVLPGTRHRYTWYGDCGRELKGADAMGNVP